jgi:hypothetical protein
MSSAGGDGGEATSMVGQDELTNQTQSNHPVKDLRRAIESSLQTLTKMASGEQHLQEAGAEDGGEGRITREEEVAQEVADGLLLESVRTFQEDMEDLLKISFAEETVHDLVPELRETTEGCVGSGRVRLHDQVDETRDSGEHLLRRGRGKTAVEGRQQTTELRSIECELS